MWLLRIFPENCTSTFYGDCRHLQFTVSQQFEVKSTKRLNKNKQNRQCTYNVLLRRVRVAIIAAEKQ